MTREVFTHIDNRQQFHEILCQNKIVVIKFGADWCGPCKKIKDLFYNKIMNLNSQILVGDVDVDESFDVYAFLKSKKMVNGIPVILAYKANNESFIPDLSVTGTNETEIINFFNEINRWEI